MAIVALAAVGFMILPSTSRPSAAQGTAIDKYCGKKNPADLADLGAMIEGRWSVRYKAGYVVTSGMVMPHPASGKTESGTLKLRNTALTLVPDGKGPDIAFHWVTDEQWQFDKKPSLPKGTHMMPGMGKLPSLDIDKDELGLIAGCAADDLPRLAGEGSATAKGVAMHFALRLMIVNTDLIYGFQQVDGTARGVPVMERRPFVMHRQ